jgi:hypothetical protein
MITKLVTHYEYFARYEARNAPVKRSFDRELVELEGG